ncbi:hypothetical protein SeMB42_g07439 [Synchytrium endobioticum]|uniref:YABBY protein C-terminal domain-containing protein n=1 Tax=Synchytrium endobioticum TaxID=286115 RepID=A0A507CJN1_9FUNG|nr:hypothetical protein SeMB42_g07439 [Synchytrium endobioticum]TPX39942.1 hypothetical protein SeLEV6574_g06906 [Synchytrium endobioticum]
MKPFPHIKTGIVTHPSTVTTINMPKVAKAEKKSAPKKTPATTGSGKRVSPYNNFMKTELSKVKTSHPNLNHREAFKMAASNWKSSPENPTNKK